MSRIGNKPITIPTNVSVKVEKSLVTVTGPKGSLTQKVDTDISIELSDGSVAVKRPTDQKRHKALHGLYRSLINNMIIGVSQGYKHDLELVGVGYKVTATANVLELNLGYSHNIFLAVPPEIGVNAVTEKGKNPTIILTGIDKQLIGQIAAKIRSFRKVEPYKGKGIRFTGEIVRRKAGKTAAKK